MVYKDAQRYGVQVSDTTMLNRITNAHFIKTKMPAIEITGILLLAIL